ncbi:MAG TPA: Fic/DOC family N-terminal domain-containing protein [Thermoanaerobaculia bacterium]|nr:Fic/DOC family N-terminal domain-containing protein [Thermoanaerobaculia bacterium]HQR66110.1 Fic/DOC family N-terminal domain-containing protein [Thermoanaerobaculia bacterium]
MKRGSTGHYVVVSRSGGEIVRAFVPRPLPPTPPLKPDSGLLEALDRAHLALGRLDAVSTLLPDTELFLYTYVRKEAVLSSQIEGTQSSLSDLLLFELEELPGVPLEDVSEVSRYVAALEYGLKRIRSGFPLSNRLLREIHGILLSKGRGAEKEPGEFRRTQNWIGGTRPGDALFVPPPPGDVPDAMAALEKFLHDRPQRTSPLVKAALSHVQFETIHPFLDGNGRLGRLLVTLLLCAERILHEPLLYLSLYLKKHRRTYYDLLMSVRQDGDWERWVAFFAEAVETTANAAVETACTLGDLFSGDRARIMSLGRGADSALRIHVELQRRPLVTATALCRSTKLTPPTVGRALRELVGLGIVRETTGRKRGRVFVYDQYLSRLNQGTESP